MAYFSILMSAFLMDFHDIITFGNLSVAAMLVFWSVSSIWSSILPFVVYLILFRCSGNVSIDLGALLSFYLL